MEKAEDILIKKLEELEKELDSKDLNDILSRQLIEEEIQRVERFLITKKEESRYVRR